MQQDRYAHSVYPVPDRAVHVGIQFRDWVAAMALQGLVAKGLEVTGDRFLTQQDKDRELVERAYGLADAMVAKSLEQEVEASLR